MERWNAAGDGSEVKHGLESKVKATEVVGRKWWCRAEMKVVAGDFGDRQPAEIVKKQEKPKAFGEEQKELKI